MRRYEADSDPILSEMAKWALARIADRNATAGLDNDRLGVLVHEVRSPVAALAAVAEIRSGLSPRVRRDSPLTVALAACRAIERIVLDVAASVRLEPVDVSALVRDAVAAHRVRGAIAVVVDEGLRVDGDPAQRQRRRQSHRERARPRRQR